MKTQIRKGCFETNSSSIHAMCICTEEEFEALKEGKKVVLIRHGEIYDSIEEGLIDHPYAYEEDFFTGPELDEYVEEHCLEDFCEERILPSGEKVIAFGYYGRDGL